MVMESVNANTSHFLTLCFLSEYTNEWLPLSIVAVFKISGVLWNGSLAYFGPQALPNATL